MTKTLLQPDQDRLLSYSQLGRRWACDRVTAAKRVKQFGIPRIRMNERSIYVRLSDVLKVEEQLEVPA
jgi:hypothetical protein